MGLQGDHSVHVIKLQVMFEWSLELWFLHSVCHHMVLNISVKFHEDVLNGFKVIEWTLFCHRNCYLQSSKGHNSKSIYPRDMVLALCTSSNVG